MEKYLINGGKKLAGRIRISGAKNAAVAILPAAILCDEPCRIENVPNISDVNIIYNILRDLGAKVKVINKTTVEIDPTSVRTYDVPYERAKLMRASYYFLGALLGKYQRARVALPGGCDFGVRPVDQHLKAFKALGAEWTLDTGMIQLESEHLAGSDIYFDVVTVGATINAILAAVRADGMTVIENAAKEPHIVDVANFLNAMGAQIRGAGTDVIKIKGVSYLHGVEYSIIPDQIEAGTYMVAAAATASDLIIENVIPKHLESITSKLQKIGATVIEEDTSVRVIGSTPIQKINVKTMVYPGFPTDMQPQIVALLSTCNGTSIVTEGVWENRFKYVDELRRMGANISVDGRVAIIEGVSHLTGAPVRATDLRAGAAMVIAALAAQGTTEIEDIHFIERGYESIEEKLRSVGADIRKIVLPDAVEFAASI
jgi:UDP-N-acetylglucosamine 1-carboxyvinyltransferase